MSLACHYEPTIMEAYKINYFPKWDDEGTHYSQGITIAMTPARMAEINAKIGELAFARECGINTDRRYKNDRNTVFNIIEA